MTSSVLPVVPEGELKERLAGVRYVFTDLDGTMLAPGSRVLADAAGNPSVACVQTLLDLRAAGVEVIPCSGRNRSMLHEDARILGFNAYIGEMGGLLMLDHGKDDWCYFTADMDYDPSCGLTPHQVIERAGVCDKLVNSWPHLLEYHNDMQQGYKYREVTVAMRGEIPDEQARALLDASGVELDWGDNGFLNHISKPTTLELPEGVSGRAFNVIPRGLNKGRAVAKFCELRGIDPMQALAIGDASSDFLMADSVGTFVLVENGLANPGADEFLATRDNAFVSQGCIVDGWVMTMKCLLAAKE